MLIQQIKRIMQNIKKIGNVMDSKGICEYQNEYNKKVVQFDELVEKSLFKIDILMTMLNSKLLTTTDRNKLEQEIEDIQRMLLINKKKLDRLRKQDRQLFVVAFLLILICFLTYILYYSIMNMRFSKSLSLNTK